MKTALKTILLLLLLVLLAEGVYELCFWHHDRMAYSGPLAKQVDRINATGADILYLGESSNHTYGLDDTDTAWISHLLGRHFPEKHVADMTHDASHAEVYYLLLKNLRQDCPIGTVVVTMNLRSFSVNRFCRSMGKGITAFLYTGLPGFPFRRGPAGPFSGWPAGRLFHRPCG